MRNCWARFPEAESPAQLVVMGDATMSTSRTGVGLILDPVRHYTPGQEYLRTGSLTVAAR